MRIHLPPLLVHIKVEVPQQPQESGREAAQLRDAVRCAALSRAHTDVLRDLCVIVCAMEGVSAAAQLRDAVGRAALCRAHMNVFCDLCVCVHVCACMCMLAPRACVGL